MGEIITPASEKKFLSSSRLVSVLLVVVSLMTFLTFKKFFEVGMVVTPTEAQIKKLTKQVNRNPDSIETRLNLAQAFQAVKRFEEAGGQYNEVLKSDPDNQAALYNLGVMAWESKNAQEAIGLFIHLLEKHPGHILGSVKMGNIYIQKGMYDDAIRVADAAIRERGGIVELHMIKGKALEAKGEYDSAVAEYRRVLKYVPNYKKALEAIDRIY